MNFQMMYLKRVKSSLSILGLVTLFFTACTSCSCDSGNSATAKVDIWQEPQEVPVAQQEIPIIEQTQELKDTELKSPETSEIKTVIKRPTANLSESLSFLMELNQQKVTALCPLNENSLENQQALLIPAAAERTTKSVRT